MCGIFCCCGPSDGDIFRNDEKLLKLLKRRGPDTLQQLSFTKHDYLFKFIGSVLHLRGNEISKQPITENSDVLVWNGEIFNCGRDEQDESDTLYLFNQLKQCNENGSTVYQVISNIRGPFAFIYWNDCEQNLYFGRDFIGRRSLCWKKVDEPFSLVLSSVCPPGAQGWEEVPANGIFNLGFAKNCPTIKLTRWNRDVAGGLCDPSSQLNSPINTTLNDICPGDLVEVVTIDDTCVSDFIQVLSESIKTRITKFNQLCQICIESHAKICHHSSIAVLFSGGLDSTILALLSDKYLPQQQSIDLINVAFSPSAPDRFTGLEAFDEIQMIRPERKWNFVKIDVTLEDLQNFRNEQIKHLVNPLNTVLDDSVACAVWFAARGEGVLGLQEYKSPARVVILGMGADEQLAGYSRHRSVFQTKGWEGLIDEIKTGLKRIHTRNLGRDDRVISDHGKEARFPYLDERVINYLNSLPVWKKANLTLERGKGEKLLLRLVAQKLGLMKVSGYWKRAIQFGSRIARLESSKEKGSDHCTRLSDYSSQESSNR